MKLCIYYCTFCSRILVVNIVLFLLTACNNGGFVPSNIGNSTTAGQVAYMVDGYLQPQQIVENNALAKSSKMNTATNSTSQMIVNVTGAIANVSSTVVNYYSSNSCPASALLPSTVTMLPSGGASYYSYPIGGYYTTNSGNYSLCSGYPGGCAGESVAVKSMKYTYNYTTTGYAAAESVSLCVSNAANTPSGDYLKNWATSGTCSSSNCGWSQSYSITLAPVASLLTASAVASGFVSGGTGQTTSSYYQVSTGSTATLTITYKNTSSNTLSGFTTTENSLPSGWIVSTKGCSNTTLAPNGTCSNIYSVNSTNTGTANINFNTMIKVGWTNSSNNNIYSNQVILPTNFPSGIAYVNVFGVNYVFSSSSTGTPIITGTDEQSTFYIKYTLSGVLNSLSTFTIYETNTANTTNGISSNIPCNISGSNNAACILPLNSSAASIAPTQQPNPVAFTFSTTTTGIKPYPSTANLNLTFKYIGITPATFIGGTVGNATSANILCLSSLGAESIAVLGYATTNTITGLTSNTTYYTISNNGRFIGTTNSNADFISSLAASIGNSAIHVWTGISANVNPWTIGVNNATCTSWTTTSTTGIYGLANSIAVSTVFGSNNSSSKDTCSTANAIYCVQQ